MRSLLLVLSFCVIGCAGGSGSGSSDRTKDLFSFWRAADNSSLEMTGGDFGNFTMIFEEANTTCSCLVDLQGSQKSGTAIFGSCAWNGPGASQCGTIEFQTYSYLNVGGTLTVCNTAVSSCQSYN